MPRCRACILSFLLIALLLPAGTLPSLPRRRADQVQVTTPALRSIRTAAAGRRARKCSRARRCPARGRSSISMRWITIALRSPRSPMTRRSTTKWASSSCCYATLAGERARISKTPSMPTRPYSDAYNNPGRDFPHQQEVRKAIDRYTKADQLNEDMASYYSNLGAACSRRRNLRNRRPLTPEALGRDPMYSSVHRRTVARADGASGDRAPLRLRSGEDLRQDGRADRSLEYSSARALEEHGADQQCLAGLGVFRRARDPRFNQLMASRILAIADLANHHCSLWASGLQSKPLLKALHRAGFHGLECLHYSWKQQGGE